MLRVGIVGVGKIGSRFDEEPGRRMPWSHVGAYLAHPTAITLVGVAEVDGSNRDAFERRCPGIPVFAGAAELMRETAPDAVSICTPTARHLDDVEAVLETGCVRALWCEKPLAASLDGARRLLSAARARNAAVVVSYVRRWLPLWRRVREIAASGALGAVVSVRVAMPNRLLTIQSHAVDLALFLGGEGLSFAAVQLAALAEDGEPAAMIAIDFASGAHGIVHPTGMRSQLLIEAEIVGAEGRVRAAEHDGKIAVERFEPSGRYSGYRELSAPRIESAPSLDSFSPFAAIAGDIAQAAKTGELQALDNGNDALRVQQILAGAMDRPCSMQALT